MSSPWTSSDDDLITIAPSASIPPPPPQTLVHHHTRSLSISSSSSSSSSSYSRAASTVGSCARLGADECAALWECMLALQRQYGCYRRSARMQAASYLSEHGLASDFMPSRAAMDLLNSSLDDLPDDGWRMLARHVSVHHPPSDSSEYDDDGCTTCHDAGDSDCEGQHRRGRRRHRRASAVWPRLAKRLSASFSR